MQSIDWDIFRYIIAVVDSGSAVGAARVLGVDGTTVIRRITRFEQDRGIQLFERLPSGYSPTAECEAITKMAREMQDGVLEINRQITGHDLRLEGTISLTTTDSFLEAILADSVYKFCQIHPQIRIDIMVTTSRLNLSRQDAHVAVRASKQPPDNLICQRVSSVAFSVYGAQSLVSQLPESIQIADLRNRAWVGPGDPLSRSPAGDWLHGHVPVECIKSTADSFIAMRWLARSGVGFAVLPCCLGDTDPALQRVMGPIEDMTTGLWVLTHPDVRKAARVQAFTTFLGGELRAHQALLEGK